MIYQNILRWHCYPEEGESILANLKSCERIGRFQCLEEIPGGARFRTFIKPLDNFFADIYQDYPAIRFSHEYASSRMHDYCRAIFLDGDVIDYHIPDTQGPVWPVQGRGGESTRPEDLRGCVGPLCAGFRLGGFTKDHPGSRCRIFKQEKGSGLRLLPEPFHIARQRRSFQGIPGLLCKNWYGAGFGAVTPGYGAVTR